MTVWLRYAARSDVGLLRDGNEDSLYAGPRLLAIADGMGGQAAGEVASSVVIATLAPLDADAAGADLLDALAAATRSANDCLRQMMDENPHLGGMGTTLTAMLVEGSRMGLVHIGDSRAYLLRDGTFARITRDHSLVQSLVDEGRITADEAVSHPHRALILRAVDGSDIDPDLSVRELRVGDRYLLCSDGLTDVVSEPTLRDTLSQAAGPEQACDLLVQLALRGGGPDNISCIVADVVDRDPGRGEVVVLGAAAEGDVPQLPSADTPAGRAALAALAHHARPGDNRPDGPAPSHPPDARHHRPRAASRRRRAARIVASTLAVLCVVAGGVVAAWLYVRAQYYVGADGGQVAVYRGVRGDVLGVPLQSVASRPGIPLTALTEAERERVQQGIDAAGPADAQAIVDRLRPSPSPSATTLPSPTPTCTRVAVTPSTTPPADTTAGGGPCTGIDQ